MKKIKRYVGCLGLLGLGVLYFSSATIGGIGLWFTLVAAGVGFVIGGLLGAGIGIAGGGGAVKGTSLLGILFAIVFALMANSGALTVSSWLDSFSTQQQSAQTIPTATAAPSTPTRIAISQISYSEIEGYYETMSRSDWRQYMRSLIGKRVRWSGVVNQKSDDNINVYMGQNKLTRRIYLADLSESTISGLKEHQVVEFDGTIYEISQILGLNLYLTDVSFINTQVEN